MPNRRLLKQQIVGELLLTTVSVALYLPHTVIEVARSISVAVAVLAGLGLIILLGRLDRTVPDHAPINRWEVGWFVSTSTLSIFPLFSTHLIGRLSAYDQIMTGLMVIAALCNIGGVLHRATTLRAAA